MNQKPKRILYIQKPKGGGSTVSLYELIKGLDTKLYEPIILFLLENKYIDDFNNLGIKTLFLDTSKSDKKKQITKYVVGKIYYLIIVDFFLALRIAWRIKQENIDIVHQNLAFDRSVMIASRITRTPEVFHFRTFRDKVSFFIKRLISPADATLYTTQAIADCYTNLGITVTKSSIVYEPIDIQSFSEKRVNTIRQQFLIKNDEYIISNVGRITPWKGQHYFLKAMESIILQYPNIKILIVGEPGESRKDKDYLNILQKLAQQELLSKHIIFTGKRDDIAEIMEASDIVVHSASKPEPFGLVIAEAMAVGTPVIATKGGGAVEIIKDGETGLLVPMASSIGIKNAIEKLLESKELRKEISIKARKDVAERFPIEKHVTKVQNIYKDILKTSF